MQRFSELVAAFVELTGERNDVQLRGSTAPPPLGFAVRLQPWPRSPGAELVVSMDRARLTSWNPHGNCAEGTGAEHHLELDLSDGFRWDCLVFPDGHTLAMTLLQRLQHEIESRTHAG